MQTSLLRQSDTLVHASAPIEDIQPKQLTGRELQILHLICDGYTGKEIAHRLGIAFKTAVTHRTSVMNKLGARNTARLVRSAIRSGIVRA
jgi:DNA-binding NarL/FixJ family response regulator